VLVQLLLLLLLLPLLLLLLLLQLLLLLFLLRLLLWSHKHTNASWLLPFSCTQVLVSRGNSN
jgi:hypothetical protein